MKKEKDKTKKNLSTERRRFRENKLRMTKIKEKMVMKRVKKKS
jgi:hypothetical protein